MGYTARMQVCHASQNAYSRFNCFGMREGGVLDLAQYALALKQMAQLMRHRHTKHSAAFHKIQ